MEGLSETSTMETQKTLSKIFSFNYNKVAIELINRIKKKWTMLSLVSCIIVYSENNLKYRRLPTVNIRIIFNIANIAILLKG